MGILSFQLAKKKIVLTRATDPTRFAVAQVKLRNRTFSGTKNARSLSHTRSCNKVAGPIRSRKNWEMSIQETDP